MNLVTLPLESMFCETMPRVQWRSLLVSRRIYPRQRPHRVMAADQGLIEGQAHHLLRYRRIQGSDVKILADVLQSTRGLGLP